MTTTILPFLLRTLAVPFAILAMASYHLIDKLAAAAQDWIAHCAFTEQVAWVALVLGLVWTAHGSLQIVTSATTTTTNHPTTTLTVIQYPLKEIEAAVTDRDKFLCLYPMLREQLLQHMKDNEMPTNAVEWCKQMMDYNVPGGKLNRGITVLTVYQALLQKNQNQPLSPYQVAQAAVCGWSIEFLQAFFLVADDVMDDSVTRRGQPCWYKLSHVKLVAINDAFLLESFVFTILHQHFTGTTYYARLVELLLDVIQKTEFGQLLDLTTASTTTTTPSTNANKDNLDKFSLEQYQRIVKYKTAYYTFYLPVAMGMILSGVTQPQAYHTAQTICCIMGEYFQVQDDYLDCFGDPTIIGKVGTDIQDNKCSWLIVQALQRCTPAQRQVLATHYGQWNDGKVARVKKLYNELQLPQVFATYEEESYQRIQTELDHVTLMPRAVFEVLLKKIYKRSY